MNTNERLIWYNIRMSNEMFERNLPPYLAHDLMTDLQRQFYKTYLAARYAAMFGPLSSRKGSPKISHTICE